jgi:hypothetical protein
MRAPTARVVPVVTAFLDRTLAHEKDSAGRAAMLHGRRPGALDVTSSLPHRDTIVVLTFAVVASSVFVQGLTTAPLLRRLGQMPSHRSTEIR